MEFQFFFFYLKTLLVVSTKHLLTETLSRGRKCKILHISFLELIDNLNHIQILSFSEINFNILPLSCSNVHISICRSNLFVKFFGTQLAVLGGSILGTLLSEKVSSSFQPLFISSYISSVILFLQSIAIKFYSMRLSPLELGTINMHE